MRFDSRKGFRMRASLQLFALILGLTAGACGGSTTQPENSRSAATLATDGRAVATDKSAYAVFPDADSGADPSVPAAQGGRGFTGEGWQTNTDYDLIGDLRRVGITLNLRFTTFETAVKLLDDRAFDMVEIAYTGETFPRPDASWLSQLADQKNNNNITAFKNARADEIMLRYQKTFDIGTRTKLLQELDGILTSEHHWIFDWTAPYERVAYWHKFGYPQGYLTRIGSFRDIVRLWWIDPERSRRLDEARRDQSIQLGEGPTDDKYWLEFARLESEGTSGTRASGTR